MADQRPGLAGLHVLAQSLRVLRLQPVRSWQRVIEINLLGVMYTDRAALPHLERSRGYLLNIAIFQRDMPLLQGIVLVLSTTFVLLNLAVDVVQGLIDPRIVRG